MTVRVGVIDYAISNLASVLNALRHIGVEAERVRDGQRIQEFTHLVLPGVGSFATGMANLRNYGLVEPIRVAAARSTPLLGLCLGMQLLAEEGQEYGPTAGLGLLPGRIVRIETSGSELRLPHVGWNEVTPRGPSRLLASLPAPSNFYFVHSYAYSAPDADYVTGVTDYAGTQVALVEQGNVFGAQFHPEKSQGQGMQLLKNFVAVAPA
jgi:glutamine amidotransferase